MSSRPKLIIINGPLGSGKSTLAGVYAENHPMTLRLDIDDVWAMVSHWREHNDASTVLAKDMAVAMAREALLAGSDVVVPQIIQAEVLAERFRLLAEECHADYYEFLLVVPKAEAIERFIERNKKKGHPTGFREGGIIATHGREQRLADMHDNMMKVARQRNGTIDITSIYGNVEETYATIMDSIRI